MSFSGLEIAAAVIAVLALAVFARAFVKGGKMLGTFMDRKAGSGD
jgi:hypothetical protein